MENNFLTPNRPNNVLLRESTVEQLEPIDYSLSLVASFSTTEIQPEAPSPQPSTLLSCQSTPDENKNKISINSTSDCSMHAKFQPQIITSQTETSIESSSLTKVCFLPLNPSTTETEQIRLSPQLSRLLNYKSFTENDNLSLETSSLNFSNNSEVQRRGYVPEATIIQSYPDQDFKEKVRVFGAYDMGWNTRGCGFEYDSLSGVGHLMGCQSGKVMSYSTRIRECKNCDVGNMCHDCRLNSYGTATAMEADVAVELVTQNPLLKEANIEIEVLVGDNDSSSICSIQKSC